jgi:peptidoglycan/xylan/chitin deacetylase (PgdA/CDA1 family)
MAFKKYFTMSYDDGVEQDKRLIEILRRHGLKCTFILNSGLFDSRSQLLRAGELGFAGVKDPHRFPASLFKSVAVHRIPANEIAQVYDGFEIATHGSQHKLLTRLGKEDLQVEIAEDVNVLSGLFGKPVTGHAYPFGQYNQAVITNLRDCGIRYARTVRSNRSFEMPKDLYVIDPTCMHWDKDVFVLLDRFIHAEPQTGDLLFYLWGHAYEFDFGTERNNWGTIERICATITGKKDICYGTNQEVFSN